MSCKQCEETYIQDCSCEQELCSCKIKLSTICIFYEGVRLTVLDTYKGQDLESILKKIDSLFSEVFTILEGELHKSIGDGAAVYKQVNHLSQAEFRSILSSDSIDVVENLNDIGISINEDWLADFILENETTTTITNLIGGNRIGTYTNEDGTEYEIDETITTLEDNLDGTFTYTSEDGTETIIDTNSDAETITAMSNLIAGNRIATYTNESSTTFDIDETITTLVDNSDNTFTYTSENGTITTIEYVPQQKEITTNYTVLAGDTGYTIFINNGASNITITVPLGLPNNFECGFLQVGTGTVTFSTSGGAVINYPDGLGLVIEGQGYPCFIEKRNSNGEYHLTGNVTA